MNAAARVRALQAIQHLRALRAEAGLTQRSAAAALDIPLRTYRGYEYSEKLAIPNDVLEAMTALAERVHRPHDTAFGLVHYRDRTMSSVAGEWANRMGVAQAPTPLATALGVNKSTVSRWLREGSNVHLRPSELLHYERLVTKVQGQHLQRA